jgi:hypothetical protein
MPLQGKKLPEAATCGGIQYACVWHSVAALAVELRNNKGRNDRFNKL